jgi:hypothetical protein
MDAHDVDRRPQEMSAAIQPNRELASDHAH